MPSETLVVYPSSCPDVPEPLQTLKLAVRVVLPALVSVRAAARCPLSAMLLAEVFGERAAIICSPR
jgi:hypothetical protein